MKFIERKGRLFTIERKFGHTDSPRLADGSIPILPVIIEASSDKISPNILFVTIVSNCNQNGGLYLRFIHVFCMRDTRKSKALNLFWVSDKLHGCIINIHV